LPSAHYVIPSSLCSSSTNPTGTPSSDDEPTVFLKMIESGMLAGYPGY
jgi:hypothetical protein